MGRKIRIIEFTGCTENDGDTKAVHAMGDAGGDDATLCGYPLVDEVKKFEVVKGCVTCTLCISQLEHTAKYERRHGNWY